MSDKIKGLDISIYSYDKSTLWQKFSLFIKTRYFENKIKNTINIYQNLIEMWSKNICENVI